MEHVKTKDNPQHNSAYEFGFIQATKLHLNKMLESSNNEPDPAAAGTMLLLFQKLMFEANEMPTVKECGMFALDTSEGKTKIGFEWIESKRSEMLDLLNVE